MNFMKIRQMVDEILNGAHTHTHTHTHTHAHTHGHNRNPFGPYSTRGKLYCNQLHVLYIFFLLILTIRCNVNLVKLRLDCCKANCH